MNESHKNLVRIPICLRPEEYMRDFKLVKMCLKEVRRAGEAHAACPAFQ